MQLRLENAGALWALIPVFTLLVYVLVLNKIRRSEFSPLRFIGIHLALAFCVIGLSRPQGGTHVTSSVGLSSNIFIALDISRSMLVQDTLPSRIQFATTFTQRLLPALPGARFALYPFTMDGYVQVPLTTDSTAVRDLLGALSPNIITLQGTDLNQSLETLLTRIQESEERTRSRGGEWAGAQVLLLSDGETHTELKTSILNKFHKHSIPIFTVMTGTPSGGLVPWDPRNGNYREPSSRNNISRAMPSVLEKISEITGGRAFPGSFDSLDPIIRLLSRAMQMGKLTTQFRVEREFFPYCFLFALLFFSVCIAKERWEYSIRTIIVISIVGSACLSRPLFAYNEKEAIEKYNEALQKLQANDQKTAIELFQESAYLSDNKEIQKKSLYSLGNAYLRTGEPAQALQAYQQAYDTLTGNRSFDEEANRRISDNMVLASQLEEQQREQSEKRKKGQGDKEGEQKGNVQDQKGPQQFQAQPMDESMKKKFFDAVSNDERQGLQRTIERRNKNSTTYNSKPW